MPSSFPGMNPYLEKPAVWSDFHSTFIGAIRAALNAVITPKYFARLGEHLIIHDVDGRRERAFAHADVSVSDLSRGRTIENSTVATTPVNLLEPKHVYETELPPERAGAPALSQCCCGVPRVPKRGNNVSTS